MLHKDAKRCSTLPDMILKGPSSACNRCSLMKIPRENHEIGKAVQSSRSTGTQTTNLSKTLGEIIKSWNHDDGYMKNLMGNHEMVRRHWSGRLTDRWSPGMIQSPALTNLLNYRKPLGISSNHEIRWSISCPSGALGRHDGAQLQNHWKPLGKWSNHERAKCDTS